MEKILKYSAIFIVAITLWSGCKEEKTILPPREVSEKVSEIAEKYNKILMSSAEGWVVAYQPENYQDSVYVKLKFSAQQKVDVLSGYRDYHTVRTGLNYTYEGEYKPVIVFDDNTIFAALANLYNGSKKFKISYIEDKDYFELVRADGFNDKMFKLERVNSQNSAKLNEQIDEILQQIAYEEEQARLSEQVRLKVKAFAEITSDLYFYNLKTANFSAAITKLDTASRQLSLTYKETPTSAPKSVEVNYTFYPKGIKLNTAIAYGSVLVDSIELGNLNNQIIEVTRAGNAGTGVMGYMNEAPYPYTLSTNRSMTLADYFMTVFPNYVQSSGEFSPKALAYSESLRNYIEDNTDYQTANRYIYFIYAPTYATAPKSFFVGAQNAAGATGNFRYDATLINLGDNKFAINELTKQVLPSGSPNIMSRVAQYLDEVSPEEGVIAVPYDTGAGYRLRLVNSTDSSIWVEYRWPSSTYWNLVFN